MKKYLRKSGKYVFSLTACAAIIIIVHFKKSPDDFHPVRDVLPILNKLTAAHQSNNTFGELPCGFKAFSLQEAEKPTFLTSNDVPVLQYPAGNTPGTTFQISDAVYSSSQSDQLILQADGNLVIYCTTCNPAKALWSTQTNGKGGKALFFLTSGDLVLRSANGKTVWHSNIRSTCPGSEQAYFTLQDDGNLVMLYDESVANSNKVVTAYLGGTASTNDQISPHQGKLQ